MSSSNGLTVPAEHLKEVEVVAKATRRRFSAEYKMKISQEADACREPGEIGALLRREGLYFSNITTWRAQRRNGALSGLAQKKRGPAPAEKNPLSVKVAAQEQEIVRLTARAERAEALVALQNKVSEILGVALKRNGEPA